LDFLKTFSSNLFLEIEAWSGLKTWSDSISGPIKINHLKINKFKEFGQASICFLKSNTYVPKELKTLNPKPFWKKGTTHLIEVLIRL
jgi:hypothetical protein